MPINERRQAAEEWATANFRHNPEGRDDGWQYEDYVVPAHLAGHERGEQRILDKLREAVNEECSCGGCGPDDPQACQACMVWHRVTGGGG